MQNILVFFGGKSVEHDVSIITGVMTLNTIKRSRFNAVPVYVDRRGKFYTGESLFDLATYNKLNYKSLKEITFKFGENKVYEVKNKRLKELFSVKCAINCMHGGLGEDGSLAGLINFLDMPFCSPNVLSSSVCMDKAFTKIVVKGLNILSLPYVLVSSVESVEEKVKKLGYPLIVKPNKLGSSIGIQKVEREKDLFSAVSSALRYGEKVIIEPCLTFFTEINCACYKDRLNKIIVSECEQPKGSKEVLSFSDKYEKGEREFPANIDEKLSNYIKKTTAKVYEALDLDGIIRVDYMIVDGKVYLNEINTVPGSLAYYLFCDTFSDFTVILQDLIEKAGFDKARENSYNKDFSCSLLNYKGIKGVKRQNELKN